MQLPFLPVFVQIMRKKIHVSIKITKKKLLLTKLQ